MTARRWLQALLGFLWFVDGLLQIKPQMFTSDFLTQVVLPTADGQPAWISDLVHFGVNLVSPHLVLWNELFAIVQIFIGLALMFQIQVRIALLASIVWSILVWSLGEGFGALFTGQALLLTGAPGAAVLYGFVSVAVWPRSQSCSQHTQQLASQLISQPAENQDWSTFGAGFARYSLAVLWLLGAGLQFQAAYLTNTGLADAISVGWVSQLIGSHGMIVSAILAVIQLVMGLLLLIGYRMRLAVWSSIVVSLVFWWVGQSFGQVFDPLSTDVNSGLVMALLSMCAFPSIATLISRPAEAARLYSLRSLLPGTSRYSSDSRLTK